MYRNVFITKIIWNKFKLDLNNPVCYEIYVEDSRVTETWYFMTREKFTAVNSYLSTLCSGDFNEGCLLTFDNVTLWRTNWKDETITVTCSFVFDSNTWNEYFP